MERDEPGHCRGTGLCAGSELLWAEDSHDWETARVIGVRTDDKGVDKQNQPKSNFEPGYDIKAKVVVLAEGTRGIAAPSNLSRSLT